jgi:HlyD family secretion protein
MNKTFFNLHTNFMQNSYQLKVLITLCLVFGIFITGCREQSDRPVTYNLHRSDFVEKIRLQGTVQAVTNTTITTPRMGGSLYRVIYLVEEGTYLNKGDTCCVLESPDLFSSLETLKTSIETMSAELKKAEAANAFDLSVLMAKVETNRAQMEISMLDSLQKKFAPPVEQQRIALELEISKIEQNKLLKQLNARKRIDISELAALRARIKIAEMRVQQATDQINALTLLAPVDGLAMHFTAPILYLGGSQGTTTLGGKIEVGSNVYTSMGVLQIPVLNEMQVILEASEADYKRIEKDQRVEIVIDAVSNLVTTGKVKRKSVVGKQVQREFAIKTYEIVLSVDSCHTRMTPGLSATCDLYINEENDVVVVPAVAVFESDSAKYVYVKQKEKFIKTDIETGLTNSSEIIVTRGLTGDETIAITEPSHKLLADIKIEAKPHNTHVINE